MLTGHLIRGRDTDQQLVLPGQALVVVLGRLQSLVQLDDQLLIFLLVHGGRALRTSRLALGRHRPRTVVSVLHIFSVNKVTFFCLSLSFQSLIKLLPLCTLK